MAIFRFNWLVLSSSYTTPKFHRFMGTVAFNLSKYFSQKLALTNKKCSKKKKYQKWCQLQATIAYTC